MTIKHEVRFSTRRTPADAKAVCSCGWFTFGALWECQDAAAVHDTEWEAVDPDKITDQAIALVRS